MRIFIIVLAVVYWAGASFATSIVVRPANCPVAADLTPLTAGDAEAGDLNAWRQAADEVRPIHDVAIAETAGDERLFARFRPDPETGEALKRPGRDCGE